MVRLVMVPSNVSEEEVKRKTEFFNWTRHPPFQLDQFYQEIGILEDDLKLFANV